MTNKIDLNVPPGGWLLMLIVYAILAYFVYDQNLNAVLGVLVIAIITGLIFMLSLIPFLGWAAAIAISYYIAIPGLVNIVGIEYTWLITLIFGVNIIGGFLISVMVLFMIMTIVAR